MKRMVSLITAVWICVSSIAQGHTGKVVLSLSTVKTTSLIFPYGIRHVDIGTKDVLVQQASETENLLFVKAAKKDFEPTNVNVVTADGQLYTFEVNYQAQPLKTVFRLPVITSTAPEVYFPGELMNRRDVEMYAKAILDNPRSCYGIKDINWNIYAGMYGIYIKDRLVFYQLAINNPTSVGYDIDYIRFYIRDRKKGKRKAAQEVELPVIYKTGNSDRIHAKNKNILVFALPKFTVPDAKYFFIEIGEKKGGRHLKLKISNKKLMRAKILPSYR